MRSFLVISQLPDSAYAPVRGRPPSMWMMRGLRAILSITASAMAPLPSFACHVDGANCERGMGDPVRPLGLMGSVGLRGLVGLAQRENSSGRV